jgi:hypothetical protein
VAGVLAGAGQLQQAEAVARSISDSHRQARALTLVAEALAEVGDHVAAVTCGKPTSCWISSTATERGDLRAACIAGWHPTLR